MRVNLLTIHAPLNYGAVLQAYSLRQTLVDLGHQPTVVDLRPAFMWPRRPPPNPGVVLKRWRFKAFLRQHVGSFTRVYREPGELAKDVPPGDAFVVGSDQVWNPEITRGFRRDYLLDFVPAGRRKLSYAASFGLQRLDPTEAERRELAASLERYDAISVREPSGAEYCSALLGRRVPQVMDPVFLRSDRFASLLGTSPTAGGGLVCFKFVQDTDFIATAGELAGRLKLGCRILNPLRVPGFRTDWVPSPTRWLARLRAADFVYTDSFHAVALAMIFRKNFVAVPAKPERFGRILELLRMFGLEDRAFGSYAELRQDARWMHPIDYTRVDAELPSRVSQSIAYLREALDLGRV